MKTGYICASGLNIVATARRNGRELMAVVLGSSSGRERGEMAAELFLRGYSGALQVSGKSVSQISNLQAPPVDMRPKLCGKEAKAYVAQREAEYPMGLKGQLSYLNDEIEGVSYAAVNLGRIRNVPLPRPRPGYAPAISLPQVEVAVAGMPGPDMLPQPESLVPMPRPRPNR
jgi:D-alanyl-D-alanine carboxypeptidase